MRTQARGLNADLEHDNVTVKFAIYRVSGDWSGLLGSVPANPSPEELMYWKPFDYTSTLDDKRERDLNPDRFNKSKCCEGSIRLRILDQAPNIKYGSCRVKFKRPQVLKFREGDQHGNRPVKYKYFTVIRSNVATTADSALKPHVCVMSRLFYELE